MPKNSELLAVTKCENHIEHFTFCYFPYANVRNFPTWPVLLTKSIKSSSHKLPIRFLKNFIRSLIITALKKDFESGFTFSGFQYSWTFMTFPTISQLSREDFCFCRIYNTFFNQHILFKIWATLPNLHNGIANIQEVISVKQNCNHPLKSDQVTFTWWGVGLCFDICNPVQPSGLLKK